MDKTKVLFFLINLVGGVAVLGGYVYGLSTHPGEGKLLWGDVPEAVRPIYTACMFPAAAGYLVSFAYLMRSNWSELRIKNKSATQRILVIHILFLTTAALWMPVSWQALDNAQPSLFWPIQIILLITGLGSLAIAWLYRQFDNPPHPTWARRCFWAVHLLVWQCLVLDALVWPRFFDIPGV